MFLILYYRNKRLLENYPEPKRFPSITFLVPAYNEEEAISDTLNALINLEYPQGKKKIIVVNDGSKDKTADIVREFIKEHKEIRLLNKPNSGKADSLNQALKMVDTELFAVTDADSYPEKDSLKKMVGYFEEDSQIAAVTSRVLVKNKDNFIERFQDFDYVVIAWTRKLLDYVDSVYVTNGPLSIYKSNVVKKLGGFDKNNITEDIELTWNILSHGYKTKMSYSAVVYTTVPSKFKKWINQRIRWNIGGLQTMYKYKTFALKNNLFGYFVITYVSLSFFLALVGLFILLRYFLIKFYPYPLSIPYYFKGYNPFNYLFDFSIYFTILMIFGIVFFILSILYYKSAIKSASLKNKNLLTILTYAFVYRPLYLIPLVLAIFRMIKGNITWYTK